MGNSYISSYFHIVFSTKGREPMIGKDWRERLWAYLGGIAAESKMKTLATGGTGNHIHTLVSLPATIAVATAVQLLKGSSSKWINEAIRPPCAFHWQEGYGAFSIGISQIEATREYIRDQGEHHRTKSFEEEFRAILKKHEIQLDEKYMWG